MAVNQSKGQVDEIVQPDSESYESLLDEYSHLAAPAAGEILQGTILKITPKEAIVDFEYKSEGLVPIEQFLTRGELTIQPGDVVDVMIDHGEPQEGYVLLSHE